VGEPLKRSVGPLRAMLRSLARIYDDGGSLLRVEYALFEGDPKFVTAVALHFESVSPVFRAISDDDTLVVTLSPLDLEAREIAIDVSQGMPWSLCRDHKIRWAWQLTNHQGYTDGVRLEFGKPTERSRAVVELIVAASAIQMFALPGDAAEQALGADSP